MDDRFKHKEVDKPDRFAVSFVSRLTIIVLVSAVVGAFLIAYFLERDLTKSYSDAISSVSEAAQLLFSSLVYSALFQVFVAIPILAFAIIFYTHKVVGPIFRFTVVFREMARGGLKKPSRIREKDQLLTTLDSINDMKTGLIGFIESCGRESEKIEHLVEKLETADEQDKGNIIRELREEAASLKDLTGKLKTGGDFTPRGERG